LEDVKDSKLPSKLPIEPSKHNLEHLEDYVTSLYKKM
jgi:hypothetical protein